MCYKISLILIALILLSCSEQPSNPIAPVEFSVLAPTNTVYVFPRNHKRVELSIISGELSDNQFAVSDTNCGAFNISGPWFTDQSKKKLYFNIWANGVTTIPTTVLMTIRIGGQICKVPISVFVSDFNLVRKFETNTVSDTILIPKGGNFLLKITCKDSSDNVIPRAQIERLGFGLDYATMHNDVNSKFVLSSVDRDTVNYNFIFSAFSDIVPSNDDKVLQFLFYLSNKTLALPIKINY